MSQERYCKLCKMKLPSGILSIISKQKVYSFEDGDYCEKCAKIIIDERRNKKNIQNGTNN